MVFDLDMQLYPMIVSPWFINYYEEAQADAKLMEAPMLSIHYPYKLHRVLIVGGFLIGTGVVLVTGAWSSGLIITVFSCGFGLFIKKFARDPQ